MEMKKLNWYITVSYTHLDVYKRQPATTPVETVKSTPVETVPSTPVETKPAETPVAKTSSSTASEAGMTFKVQLGAYSSQPSKSKFSGLSNVSVDQINGLYKVTCGNFKTKDCLLYTSSTCTDRISGIN